MLKVFCFNLILAVIGSTVMSAPVTAAQPVRHFPGVTQKLLQLTGEHDRTLDIPTLSKSESQAQLVDTDLGSSFEHKGKLVFLFGDSHGGAFAMADTLAFSTSTEPLSLKITFPLDSQKRFQPIIPPGLKTGAFCVPSYGISVQGIMYIVYTQNGRGDQPMKRSFLLASGDDGRTWKSLFQLPNNTEDDPRFVNVALEERDGFIWMFGSGEYRASSVRLARAPISKFPYGWQYYIGRKSSGHESKIADWTSDPLSATELFDHDEVGELSCSWIEQLGCWVMLYNCINPNGIVMRTALQPWGPWSEPELIMDPFKDGYGQFMHVSWDDKRVDLFSDPNRHRRGAGVYGPYIIKRFCSGDAQRCGIYYTMSTWNPYQVVLMGSLVGRAPLPPSAPSTTVTIGVDAWRSYPPNLGVTFEGNGRKYVTTHGEKTAAGDRKVGWLWQKLPFGAKNLKFSTNGGHSEVYLLEGGSDLPEDGDVEDVRRLLKEGFYGRLLLRATGMNTNTNEVTHQWDLRRYGSNPLKIVVLDTQTSAWGFITVSDLELQIPL